MIISGIARKGDDGTKPGLQAVWQNIFDKDDMNQIRSDVAETIGAVKAAVTAKGISVVEATNALQAMALAIQSAYNIPKRIDVEALQSAQTLLESRLTGWGIKPEDASELVTNVMAAMTRYYNKKNDVSRRR